ncbi:rod shape-determining protein RodA [Neobacillus sp. MM2021_6]|uniref:FtsW/RodA/SpoVE family cell cycle protein n=1 Tax=Bacillaceae TaxID=186817 RepID=UPI00140A9FBD|nr:MULTISPECIES: FtsW/RodA/SpoVE family cell cycle protein [Bacillaceae]MBO0960465.1 rod shape-determining protein RodA [Neobacillus sp. MM2021_6]NHC19624.1 rod shape-determining protein RodA [Bacillus sp. MM2020_4]
MDQYKKKADRFDWTLTLLLFLFFLISCAAIYSAQASEQYGAKNFLRMQIFWYVIGAAIISVSIFIDSYQYKRLSWYLYCFGLLLLLTVYLAPESIAPIRNGAKSWFVIRGIGQIQPSEFVKTFLILALSRVITTHKENHLEKSLKTDFLLLVKLGITTAVPLGLIMLQPDLGTGLVILAILTGLILISGISWKIIIPIYGAGASFAALIFYLVLIKPEFLEKYLHVQTYQFNRIYAWLDPYSHATSSSFHLLRSLRAIGSGLVTGKGFGHREVYIPEAHTDFIFSVIGEEYGFVGGSIIVGLFFLLIYHLIKTAMHTRDPFNTYVCTGIISVITFHVFQNIGMTIQVLPITGIPLPFISYGGSSLMGNMFGMGLIYSFRYHHKTYMFSTENSLQA